MPEAAYQRNVVYMMDLFKYGRLRSSWSSLCGYAMRSTGQWEIHPAYHECDSFNGGDLAAIRKGDFWGFVDKHGNVVIDHQFAATSGFWGGAYAAVAVAKAASPLEAGRSRRRYFRSADLAWGFIRTDGSWFVEPRYDKADRFSEGFAAVERDGKWGYIDENGDITIPFQFDIAGEFSDGIAHVVRESDWRADSSVWEEIDSTGRIVGRVAR